MSTKVSEKIKNFVRLIYGQKNFKRDFLNNHLKSNIELSNSDFDLNNETLQEIYSRFKEHKNDWVQLM